MYTKTLFAGWGDIDFNSHMRNTAFLDKSADVRMMFFAENGFSMGEFFRLKMGPVIMKDEVEYFKEIGLLQEVRVTLAVSGLADDGSRFHMRNEFFRPDGTLCAKVTSAGGWLALGPRKLVAPPTPCLQHCEHCRKQATFRFCHRASNDERPGRIADEGGQNATAE